MPEALATLAIARVDAPERLGWVEGLRVSLPDSLAAALAPFLHGGRLRLDADAEFADVSERLRLHAAFTERPPASSRLPVSYQRVPMRVRTLAGRLVGALERMRASSWARFPRWPIDLSADFAADLAGAAPPRRARTAVCLSHDLDTPEGLRNLVAAFLDVEEAVGARSTGYVVPCSWPIDHGLLGEVRARGHEVGVHGYDHSNRTPFCEAGERRRRIEAARELVERYAVTGYRAPSLVRTRALLADLAPLYRYDSSIPTSGGRFPVPNNGCATARPFRIDGLLEIPLTLPRDGSLRFLGHGPEAILATWKRCAETVRRSGGVVSLLTHCEARFSGNAPMLDVYRRFLEHLAQDGRYEFTTAADLAAGVDAAGA
jgi:peptidoglycan/xylan/chitin deacetylase (PgdA/CDA1 family)